MNKTNDKFLSMIGFAKRARKIVYGYDDLLSARGVKLLAVSDTASDNLFEGMTRLAKKRGITLVKVVSLEQKIGGNVKALGVTDANMAKAMADHAADNAPQYTIVQ